MKNVTIAIDDETHRNARIRAAELGTSLSALVKNYLQQLADVPQPQGVREMPMTFHHAPPASPVPTAQPGGDGPPWFINGKCSYTRDGKPRQPGGLRGKIGMADDFDEWPEDILKSFEAWPYDDPDYNPLPFDEQQLHPK
jgi:hypothetical protein